MNLGEINSTTPTPAAISKWFTPHILSFEEPLEVNMSVLSSLHRFDNGFISHYVLETPCISKHQVFFFFFNDWHSIKSYKTEHLSHSLERDWTSSKNWSVPELRLHPPCAGRNLCMWLWYPAGSMCHRAARRPQSLWVTGREWRTNPENALHFSFYTV